ncbi:vasotab-like isoform X3 [Lycorma delicatula]|uniref:vasotab-like isoform X3 n=1 Tax=Lycorma delicatula TaxID=130591 RepID=UPI003F51001C
MDSKLFSLTVLLVMSLFFLSPAESQRCPSFCTYDYRPVCGRNSSGRMRTFDNSCLLNVFNCSNRETFRIIRNGRC